MEEKSTHLLIDKYDTIENVDKGLKHVNGLIKFTNSASKDHLSDDVIDLLTESHDFATNFKKELKQRKKELV